MHGAHRTADHYLGAATGLASDSRTLIVAPQFLLEKDIVAHSLPDRVLRWDRGNWATGGDAAGPAAISSYEAIHAILLTLADRSRLPNLTAIVLAGFSGGGQLAQRYAAVGRVADTMANPGIALRYVVGSPSSYLYFTDQRPRPEGGFGPLCRSGGVPELQPLAIRACRRLTALCRGDCKRGRGGGAGTTLRRTRCGLPLVRRMTIRTIGSSTNPAPVRRKGPTAIPGASIFLVPAASRRRDPETALRRLPAWLMILRWSSARPAAAPRCLAQSVAGRAEGAPRSRRIT